MCTTDQQTDLECLGHDGGGHGVLAEIAFNLDRLKPQLRALWVLEATTFQDGACPCFLTCCNQCMAGCVGVS